MGIKEVTVRMEMVSESSEDTVSMKSGKRYDKGPEELMNSNGGGWICGGGCARWNRQGCVMKKVCMNRIHERKYGNDEQGRDGY